MFSKNEEYMYSLALCHHGTPGMKWHVRRYQNADGSLTPEGRIHYGVGEARSNVSSSQANSSRSRSSYASSAQRVAAKVLERAHANHVRKEMKRAEKKERNDEQDKAKHPYKISSEELTKKIQRLQLEKQYKDLFSSVYTHKGRDLVIEILSSSTRNIGQQLATYGMGKLVNTIFKGDIVNPRKGQKDK